MLLQQIKPRNARSARALKQREPQAQENPKTTLFLHYTKTSQLIKLLFKDLLALKPNLSISFTKKNEIRPFEDASSLEFFSVKNDASLFVFGSNAKKRPHAVTLVRMFEHKVLDMLELLIDVESLRTLSQFKNQRKAAVGMKPMLSFSGSPFESPTPNEYTLAKSMFVDLFKGPDISNVDVEGLQYIICISADEERDEMPKPVIHIRCYMIRTKRSGQRLPLVELEEMGPRVDFRVGRMQQADSTVMKEAMKQPRGTEPRTKKNITTDLIGDKIGRIHLGKQDLGNLQTRKMKGLKRSRDLQDDFDGDADGQVELAGDVKKPRV